MKFIPLDAELARKAIEGYQNELAPELLALDAFYRQFRCKRCKSPCNKEQVAGHVFSDPNTLVPRSCLRCSVCRMLFDPHSNIILEMGEKRAPPPPMR